MNAKRMALITGSCLAAGLAGCAGNSPLNPESLLSQFNPPKPEALAVWPLLEEIDDGTPTQNIRDAFDLRADAKITI